MSGRRAWRAPCVLSRPVPLVEQLLAETYGKQAKAWASSSARRRADARGDGRP